MTKTPNETPASRLWVELGRTHVRLQHHGFTRPATVLNETVVMAQQLAAFQTAMVDKARAEGASWATIGAALGMSRQAVQKRYDR